MNKKTLLLLAVLGGACAELTAADIQDAIKQVKKNNFEKAIALQSKFMGVNDGDNLLGEISKVLMFNNPKYTNYSPLEAYSIYNRIVYSDLLYDNKVMNVLREEQIDMEQLRQDIEANLINDAKSQNTIEAYDKIISACQGCSYLDEAKKAKDDLVFNNTLSGATLADVLAFIAAEPNSPKRKEAEHLRDSLAYKDLPETSDAYYKYIHDYPNSVYTPKLKKDVEKLAYNEAKNDGTINAYAKFIANFPENKNAKDFQSEIDKDQAGLVWKIDPKYSDARYVTDSVTKKDYILVKQGNWGVLNATGAQIVAPTFEDVDGVSNGLLVVKNGGRWGLAKVDDGTIAYPANMNSKSDIQFLTPLYTAVKEGGAWGLVYKGTDQVVAPFVSGNLSDRTCKKLMTGGVALTDGKYLRTASAEGALAHDSIYDEVTWSNNASIDSRFIKVRSGKKYGIVGPDGKLMFAPQFDMIPFFDSDGIAILKNLFQEGWMDTTGHFLYYDRLNSYKDCGSDKMIAYEVNGLWGFIDKSQKGGDLERKYTALGDCFNQGFAKVKEDGQWKYIDRSGKTVYNMPANATAEVADGLLFVKNGGKTTIVNKAGNAFEADVDDFDKHASSNLIVFTKNGLKGVMDPAGRVVIPAQYEQMTRFCNDYSIVTKNGKMGMYYKNNLVIEPKYERLQDPAYVFTNDCGAFADGKVNNTIFISVANGIDNEKIVMKEGKELFRTTDEVKLVKPVDGYAVVKTAAYGSFSSNAKCALVGPKGEILVKPLYADIQYLPAENKNLYFAYKTADNKWGVLNARGVVEIPAFADKIISFDGFQALAEVDGDTQLFTKRGLPLLPKGYDVDGQIVKNKKTGKYGVIDKKGNIKVYPYYEKVIKVTDKYAVVKKGGLVGVVNY